jgi:hypothetical protein
MASYLVAHFFEVLDNLHVGLLTIRSLDLISFNIDPVVTVNEESRLDTLLVERLGQVPRVLVRTIIES